MGCSLANAATDPMRKRGAFVRRRAKVMAELRAKEEAAREALDAAACEVRNANTLRQVKFAAALLAAGRQASVEDDHLAMFTGELSDIDKTDSTAKEKSDGCGVSH